jgi:hypothetical protein
VVVTLLSPDSDLATIDAALDDIEKDLLSTPVAPQTLDQVLAPPPPPPPTPSYAPAAPAPRRPKVAVARPRARATHRLRWAFVPLAAAMVALFALTLHTGGGRTHTAGTGPTTTIELPFTGPPPDLRAAPPVVVTHETSPFHPLLLGIIVPALLVALLVALMYVLARRDDDYQSTRVRADTDALRNELRRTDRRVAVASGLVALATGLSLLYYPNAHFGSTGDYLTALLWAAAIGQGAQVARRFLPTGLA